MRNMLYPRNTLRVSRLVPLAALGLGLAACDAGETLIPSSNATLAASVAAAGDPGQQLARALAGAMGQAQVRAQVVNALRSSPYKENKVVLGEFVQTPQGRQVLRAAAAAADVDVAVAQGWVAALPAMDLYVPLEVHRREWAGTDAFVVGLNLDTDDPTLTGYRADGSILRLDARLGTPPVAVVLMHPAEPKTPRRGAKHQDGASVSNVDNEICPTSTGKEITIQCGGGGALPGDGSGGSTGYTGGEVHSFLNYEGDGWGDIELMVKTYTAVGGTRLDEKIIPGDQSTCVLPNGSSATCESDYTYSHTLIAMGPYIKAWERDSGWETGGDDYWGDASFLGYEVLHKFFPGCSIAAGNTQTSCDAAGYRVTVQIFFWHLTNYEHDGPDW